MMTKTNMAHPVMYILANIFSIIRILNSNWQKTFENRLVENIALYFYIGSSFKGAKSGFRL